MTSKISLRSILDEHKLKGDNFNDWYRNLKIVLRQEKLFYVLEKPIPPEPTEEVDQKIFDAWKKHIDDDEQAVCIMLGSMSDELQKTHEDMDAQSMIAHLKELYATSLHSVRFQVSCALFQTRYKGGSVSEHVLKMIGYIEKLASLGFLMDHEIGQDLILQSLPKGFSNFTMQFHLSSKEATLAELHNLVKQAEKDLKSEIETSVMLTGTDLKPRGLKKNKGKAKAPDHPKPNGKIEKKKGKGKCFFCGKKGHWKKDYRSLKAKEAREAQEAKKPNASGMLCMIELYSYNTELSTWVLDTSCGTHLCNNMQDLRNSRRLRYEEVNLRMGNGAKLAALCIGTYSISLPNGLVLDLDNCVYVPSLVKNIILISSLCKKGFSCLINCNECSIYFNEIKYGVGILSNGIYILQTNNECSSSNIHNINSNNPNESLLWHSRLGHINETRLTKLYKDGYFKPFTYIPYGTCEPCLLGKMTKLPFKGKGQRATEILELIHSDVCGPMSVTARGGFSYFITFIDDYSRYGYVYLMQYKSEAFDKFKDFKAEVEKQLSKNIKTLRSDRGGEYLSYEFQDYLKENGIVSQWTPPGTPQHNGVSERRNRTLLDMVRSMMPGTDLPLSFWGLALETATLLLNQVPSKIVSQTPYELWSGKRPSLSYLRVWGCDAYVKLTPTSKLDARAVKCKFVGYALNSRAYVFYVPSEQRTFVSRNAKFLEREFLLKKFSGSRLDLDEVQEEQTNIDQTPRPFKRAATEQPQGHELRRSSRERYEPQRYGFHINEEHDQVIENDDPTSFDEAIRDIDSIK